MSSSESESDWSGSVSSCPSSSSAVSSTQVSCGLDGRDVQRTGESIESSVLGGRDGRRGYSSSSGVGGRDGRRGYSSGSSGVGGRDGSGGREPVAKLVAGDGGIETNGETDSD